MQLLSTVATRVQAVRTESQKQKAKPATVFLAPHKTPHRRSMRHAAMLKALKTA